MPEKRKTRMASAGVLSVTPRAGDRPCGLPAGFDSPLFFRADRCSQFIYRFPVDKLGLQM